MDRIAPETGYVGGRKNHYRRNIWATFRSLLKSQRAAAHALLMPSIEGKEVEVALDAGLREENLFLVDRNRAIAAHLARRFPRATCYGLDVAEAARRVVRAGKRLSVANLDLCGLSTGTVGSTLREFLRSDVMGSCSAIAFSMVRGRESAEHFSLLKRCAAASFMGSLDGARLGYVYSATQGVGYRREFVRAGKYRSTAGTQTMLWTVWLLTRRPEELSEETVLQRQLDAVRERIRRTQSPHSLLVLYREELELFRRRNKAHDEARQ